ncbi:hypothetical protein BJ742DRAFT_746347 [Cladochytrium replicatum]|nr:hypothetical protein BJ742DRAFT_746347 [Cladochytrium replicatum]
MSTTENAPIPEKKTAKRDALIEQEKRIQALWKSDRVFEVDAPKPGEDLDQPKWFGTFPYPYMNGRLHLGHMFTLTKLDFAAGYQRLKGKRVLMPLAFHCTGMPIKASADKIAKEIQLFGADFSGYYKQLETEDTENLDPVPAATPSDAIVGMDVDPTKIVKKPGKVASKATGLKYQFLIMQSMGVPLEEIHKFADPIHWLYYFPPFTMQDCSSMGLHVDWRRSFITTDVNPYYDSFVRWQFNVLKSLSPPKVAFGERYTIYSALDGQACMDHDRSVGEGVGVQEYTGIKLQVLLDEVRSESEEKRDKALNGRDLFYVAATLRPETMYGQTNCYVGTELKYGIYEVDDKQAWICTERAAKNMAWQGLFTKFPRGKVILLAEVTGWDLIGLPLKTPLTVYPKVYTLPMEGVLATKGTGVVTSVPSDSPDDYITLQDLLKKPEYYNVQKKWIESFVPIPIIQAGKLGDLAAKAAVEKYKIQSQKDKPQLALAKEDAYKEGFYNGVMLVGEHAGSPVSVAKPLLRKALIESGQAIPYCEPEGLVISRSGDECVVTLAEQWYMDYGEDEWKALAKECLDKMEVYADETRNGFLKNLDWLKQWACSRSFGLGSRLPWDRNVLIESLSDSTIYMAFYTVAHLLQGGIFDGSQVGPAGIRAEQLTDEVWEFIMREGPFPTATTVPKSALEDLKREFNYFYPMDVRISGKDLINNHLTFCIYNHVAMFSKGKWPLGMRANGHLLINNEKMSKFTGNFLTAWESLELYGADATRFALATAGDSVEDANFSKDTANNTILRLYTERDWSEEVLADLAAGKLRKGPYNWGDKVFESEINNCVGATDSAYNDMLFYKAANSGFFDLQIARNEYRKNCTGQGVTGVSASEVFVGMHADLVLRFVEVQALLLAPLTPHWSEYVWTTILKKPTTIMKASWPEVGTINKSILSAATYVRDLVYKIRVAEENALRKKANKGGVKQPQADPEGIKSLRFFVASSFPKWQEDAIAILQSTYDAASNSFSGKEKELLAAAGLKDKNVMPFVAGIKRAVTDSGSSAFNRTLTFKEFETLQETSDLICRELANLKIARVDIVPQAEVLSGVQWSAEDRKKAEAALPGVPGYQISFVR